MDTTRTARIRALNDQLRQTGNVGQILATPGVTALGPLFMLRAFGEMAAFESFDDSNDPYGEHDFGSLHLDEHWLFWKIDYYGPDLKSGADDPADPDKCRRVLTIMLSDEY
ncbi:MAG: DUF3768 domain-containing protein [Caulobacteraceae bacterium]